MNKIKTEPFIEFNITEKCNYRCNYCSQGILNKENSSKLQNATDNVIDGVIELLKDLGQDYTIQFIGGEPFCHPKFIETVKKVADLGNKMIVVTNMSYPVSSYKELIQAAGKNLVRIHGSMHLSEIKDLDSNIKNIIEIKHNLYSNTEFRIMSILLDNNFELLKGIKQKLNQNGIEFIVSRLLTDGFPKKYSDEEEAFLLKQNSTYQNNIIKSINIKTKNVLCNAGSKVFHIRTNGDIERCWSYQNNPNFQVLGNVTNKKSINLLKCPMPCYANFCKCSYPSEKQTYFYSSFIPFYLFKEKYKEKFKQSIAMFLSLQ